MQLRVSHRCAVPEIRADMQLRQPLRVPQALHVAPPQPGQYATLRPCLLRKPHLAAGRLPLCRAQASATDPLAGLRILEWTGEPHQVQVSAHSYIVSYMTLDVVSEAVICRN